MGVGQLYSNRPVKGPCSDSWLFCECGDTDPLSYILLLPLNMQSSFDMGGKGLCGDDSDQPTIRGICPYNSKGVYYIVFFFTLMNLLSLPPLAFTFRNNSISFQLGGVMA